MGLTGFTSVLLAGTRGPVANTNFQLRAQGAAQVDSCSCTDRNCSDSASREHGLLQQHEVEPFSI
jgi:hypothetical protein